MTHNFGRWLTGLLAASALLLFLGLGANTIWDANEAFYVETPRQMIASGDYINPTFNGEPRMNKPVLSYWVVAGFYHAFGTSVAVQRVAIALGALGILVAAFVFGRAVGGPAAGLMATVMVATAPRFVMFSRRIFIDMWVTMFMALALACFLLAEQRPAHRRRYLYLMYAAIGLGVLTKGPVALLFPALTIGSWLLLERRLGDLKRLSLLPGALIVFAIVVPWWAVIQAQHGWGPVQAFWVGENVGRYTEAMQPWERDVFFYIPVMLGDLFPWTPFVIAGLAWGVPALWRGESPTARLLVLWVIWHVGVFSFSQSKQDLYVFPVVPALAALAACPLAYGLEHARKWIGWAAVCSAVLMAVVGGAAFWLFGAPAPLHHVAGANLLGAVLLVGAAAVVASVWNARHGMAVAIIATVMVAGNYVFALVSLPAVEAYKPSLPVVREIESRTRAGDPPPVVAHYLNVLPSMTYYLNRPVEHIFDMPVLTRRALEVPAMFILLRPADFAELQGRMSNTTVPVCLVSRYTLFEAKLKNVVEGQSWPETYLAGTGRACAR